MYAIPESDLSFIEADPPVPSPAAEYADSPASSTKESGSSSGQRRGRGGRRKKSEPKVPPMKIKLIGRSGETDSPIFFAESLGEWDGEGSGSDRGMARKCKSRREKRMFTILCKLFAYSFDILVNCMYTNCGTMELLSVYVCVFLQWQWVETRKLVHYTSKKWMMRFQQ